jgi:hypothetical protein
VHSDFDAVAQELRSHALRKLMDAVRDWEERELGRSQ